MSAPLLSIFQNETLGHGGCSWPTPCPRQTRPSPSSWPPRPPVDDEAPVQVLKASKHLQQDALNLRRARHRVESVDTLPGGHQHLQSVAAQLRQYCSRLIYCEYMNMYVVPMFVCSVCVGTFALV